MIFLVFDVDQLARDRGESCHPGPVFGDRLGKRIGTPRGLR
jgi:hypothetical protein